MGRGEAQKRLLSKIKNEGKKTKKELSQQMKLYYEDELQRALAEDGSSSSTYISPKVYYPEA